MQETDRTTCQTARSTRMRALHVTSGNLYGGIETMLVTIAQFRDAAPDMESQFAVCFDGRLRTELAATGARVHALGSVRARNPLSVRRARSGLAAVIAREEIDVVVCHSNWPLAIFGSTASASGRSLALWQHGPLGGANWLDRWARRVRPNLVIFNSYYMASTCDSVFEELPREVVYCPVPPRGISTNVDVNLRDKFRTDLGASPSDVVIVQVSRLEEWKGHRLLLDALAELREMTGWKCW